MAATVTATATCEAVIDLSRPLRSERRRAGFQPHWRTVFVYRCPSCGNEPHIMANSYRGTRPVPSVGGVTCGYTVQLTPAQLLARARNAFWGHGENCSACRQPMLDGAADVALYCETGKVLRAAVNSAYDAAGLR